MCSGCKDTTFSLLTWESTNLSTQLWYTIQKLWFMPRTCSITLASPHYVCFQMAMSSDIIFAVATQDSNSYTWKKEASVGKSKTN